jgi:membrane protease YdiL (CAAX protease family)
VVDLERPASRPVSRPVARSTAAGRPSRWLLASEILIVLGVSLGQSALIALVGFYARATGSSEGSPRGAVMYASEAPGRPLLDLVRQVMELGFAAVPVALAAYLLVRSGDGVRGPWFGTRTRVSDLARATLAAAAVAVVGLPFYVANHHVTGATVVPETLPDVWWRIPVLILAAFQNGLLEECVLLGFVLVRLRQLGLPVAPAIVLLAGLRGCYHLYQGLGGCIGNVAMGLLFGWLYHRWGRVAPLVLAHTLLDVGAFVGYVLLAGRVSWVPV